MFDFIRCSYVKMELPQEDILNNMDEIIRNPILLLDDIPNNMEEITENIRNPMKAIKYIVVFVLILISITSVTIVSTVNYSCHGNDTTTTRTVTFSTAYQDIIQNNTACNIFRMFPISFDTALTVCEYEGETRIDIRKFVNNQASIIGIHLSLDQWTKLLTMLDDINLFINNS